MSVTPSADLAGVLPVVVSGGRPRLADRVTRRHLASLHGITADPIWFVREDHAREYESDAHEIVTYGVAEAEDYARTHWLSPDPPFRPGGFLGAFAGRELACRLAERRGFWSVLLLDDNLLYLKAYVSSAAATRVVSEQGGLGMFADLLAAVTLSTNSRMTGAWMDALNPAAERMVFARPGFPYSLYLERLDRPNREPYFGPFEDDIMHAYQYGSRADDATASLVRPLLYMKEHRSASTGMRGAYDARRAEGLVLAAPEIARVGMRRKHANGQGQARIFHSMRSGSIRTPLVVTDRELFDRARARAVELRELIKPRVQQAAVERVARRAEHGEAIARFRAHLAGEPPR
jgi:post-segregation antitoxin (ccd killing protein)